jgi:periplasmic divalent cation tolerance protein
VTGLCEVVITAPDPDWLLALTRELVTEGLCASVHNFAPVRSIYRWKGEVHERTEGRASLHTKASLVNAIVSRARKPTLRGPRHLGPADHRREPGLPPLDK